MVALGVVSEVATHCFVKIGLDIFMFVAGNSGSIILNEFASYVPTKYQICNHSSYSALNQILFIRGVLIPK